MSVAAVSLSVPTPSWIIMSLPVPDTEVPVGSDSSSGITSAPAAAESSETANATAISMVKKGGVDDTFIGLVAADAADVRLRLRERRDV